MKSSQKVKAPAYFIKLYNEDIELARQKILQFNIPYEVFEKEVKNNRGEEYLKEMGLTEKEDKELSDFFKCLVVYKEYAWSKFRIENWDNGFGQADNLHFNKKTNEIEIEEKNIIEKLTGEFRKKITEAFKKR